MDKWNVPLHQDVHSVVGRPSRVKLGALAAPSLTTFASSHSLTTHGTAAYSYASMATNPPDEEPQQLRLYPRYSEPGDVARGLFEGRHFQVVSESSMGKIINMSDDIRPNSQSFRSTTTNWSLEQPSKFNEAEPLETESLTSHGTAAYSYASMTTNPPCEEPQEEMPNPRYAEPGDVACDLCEGRHFKACKSCMTCLASFCEIHIQDHYRREALQRHVLVEVTKSLDILQENAQLKKNIEEERKEKLGLRKEIETLNQKINKLMLPDYICKGRTPVAANVALDPNTAHCALTVSDDQNRVHLGEKRNIHQNKQRFDKCECVLASEGFSSGRHYWEVKLNREFTVGVTRQSSQRKGKFTFSPNEGYWCLYHFKQVFTALEDPIRHLPIETVPQVLGVCVDVEEKWVTFYNTETKAHIHTFRGMLFTIEEKIYPVFSTLSKSVDLEIRAVK